MKNAVIYARYSSDKQTEQSIEGQLRVCNEYAERNGLAIVDTYIDRATTGTNDNRPAFQKMLADSDKPVIWDIVLIYAIDRFGRNAIEIAVNKQRLRKNKKTLISATQRTSDNIDGTRNLDGILLENVYIGLAEYYSAELAQKVSRGLKENRTKGLYTGGTLTYGYKVKDKHVLIDEDQANIVREIYTMYANGHMANEIIDLLTERGVMNNTGKPFLNNAIYKILHNSKYIGRYEVNGDVFMNIFPPIIPQDLFEQVQRRIAHNKLGQKSKDTDFLLKGKIVCGYCGKHINGESGTSCTGKVMYYYKCANRKKNKSNCPKKAIPKDELEQIVLDMAMEIFTSEVDLNIIVDEIIRVNQKSIADHSTLNILLEQKAKAEKSMANVMKAIEEGIIYDITKNRVKELQDQLDDLSAKILVEQYKQENGITREQAMEYLTSGVKQDSPQLLIDLMVERIELFDDEIIVWFNYTPKTNPDDPDTDSRDFILHEKYVVIVTTAAIVVKTKL